MKNVTITWEDDVFNSATQAAAQISMPLGDFLRDLFLSRCSAKSVEHQQTTESVLASLWALADSRPVVEGSSASMSRDEIYERGIP